MIEDLKNLGVNVMNMKGDIKEIINKLTKIEVESYSSRFKTRHSSVIRQKTGEQQLLNKLLDPDTAVKMDYIQGLVKNEIAAYMKVPVSELTPELISLFELRRGQTVEAYTQTYVDAVRNNQNQRADLWLTWLDKVGEAHREGRATAEQYSKAFNLVKTVLNFNYTAFNNPKTSLYQEIQRL